MRKSVILKAASATFLDQLALSFVQFFVGIAFIYKGTPEEYGLFSFLVAICFFCTSVQNAIINTPLMVLSPRLATDDKTHFERGIFGVLSIFILITISLALVWAGNMSMKNHDEGFTTAQIVVFALFLGPLMLRTFWRAEEYAKLQPFVALKHDLVYAVLTLIGISFLIGCGRFGVTLVFAVMALAALAVAVIPTLRLCRPIPSWHEIASSIQRSWKHSSWSLLGATSSWFQGQAYIYLPFFLVGIREVAFLSAARLVMMPPALLSGSWGNYFRPLASRKLSEGNLSGTMRTFYASTLVIMSLLAVYTALVLLLLRNAPEAWLPEDYRNIGGFVILWAIIIFIMTLRNNASSIFQASLAFKPLACRGLLAAVFTVVATTVFVLSMGAVGSLFGRVGGEVFLMLILLFGLRRILASNTDSSRSNHDPCGYLHRNVSTSARP